MRKGKKMSESRNTTQLYQRIETLLRLKPRTISELRDVIILEQAQWVPAIERVLQRMRHEGKAHLINRLWATPAYRACAPCGGRGWQAGVAMGKTIICPSCQGTSWVRWIPAPKGAAHANE